MSVKILIVDDETEVLEAVDTLLSTRGFEILTAQGGHEAIALLKNCQPELVILDIRMKGMDGMEILKKAKELNPSVQVAMITGLNDEGIEEKCRGLGAAHFLRKPLGVEELEKVVAEFNDRK
tara:strand:+ start:154 stop:519 length:366 start_codon:yes stop_codon:yes gene_type:complete